MFQAQKILVPTDFSDHANLALKKAASIAGQGNGKIILVHVINSTLLQAAMEIAGFQSDHAVFISGFMDEQTLSFANDMLDKEIASLNGSRPAIKTEIVSGDPVSEILKLDKANGIDLIVMGAHGRKGAQEDNHLGSVAYNTVKGAKHTVVVVKS